MFSLDSRPNITRLRALANTWTATNTYGNNVLLAFGAGNDIVALDRSTTLAADTALTNVLIGTPVSEAIAADTFILSNTTAAGDIAFYGNRGGNSEQFFFYDTSAGVLYLAPYAGGLMAALTADPPAPDNSNFHIWAGSAGTVTAASNRLFVIENSATAGMTFLVPATGTGFFASESPTSNDVGILEYIHSGGSPASTWRWSTAGSARLSLTGTTLSFSAAAAITTSAGALNLRAVNALNNAVNVNDDNGDVNFYVSGDTVSTIMGVDAGLDSPFIGLASLGTVDTKGFPQMSSMAGSASGTPNQITGFSPFHFDTTNNRFRIYNGAWLNVALDSSYVNVTAATYSALTTDRIIGVNRAGAVTVTLPTAALIAGKAYVVKDESGAAGTNNITVDTQGSELIDGAASQVLSTNYGSQGYYSDGTNWFKV